MVEGRRRAWLAWILGLVALIVLVGAIGVAFIYSGLYNVSARWRDSAPVAWVLSTTMDHSVHRHARGIKAPPLDDPTMIEAGLSHYREDCVMCHGAPGVKIGEVGRGLNPDPPEMTEAASDWRPSELFWITKNGIRMSGMPAWGVTHSDKDIWEVVAFARKLPGMKPAEYQAMIRKAGPMEH